MKAEIISIGSELVLGELVDTNAAYLSERLARIGVDVRFHTSVGDSIDDLCAVMATACSRADIVILTGGLGPTRDDITRQAVARLCGVELFEDETSLKHIEDLFRSRSRRMPESNRVQAMFPIGATIIPNHLGTAPGFCIEHNGSQIMTMPGVPTEMKKMFGEWVLPYVKERLPARQAILTKDLRCIGAPESEIGIKLHDLMDPARNPFVATQASEGIITIRIVGRAESEESTEALLKETAAEVRRRIGDPVFMEGKGGLEVAVAGLLAEKGLTLAVAESCTGGLIGHWLTNVPGISNHLLEDVVSYSNPAKVEILGVPAALIERRGAVSDEVARAMAEGVRKRAGADLGLSTTGIAGPGGGSEKKPVGLVFIAVVSRLGTTSKGLRLWGDREMVKDRASKAALNLLREELVRL
ncbi:MAG: competence/damage-inducible protein A [Planctomycetes bacterium]|nr:competence/damage-inducible protein A [Planctomycetota bacterium]